MSLHIEAQVSDIAENVLLPGDPLRAERIANDFFVNPVKYNSVRNMLGFSGSYKGVKVSTQGTGMGMPSISIYVEELIRHFGVKTLIRTGTCGAIAPNIELGEIILAITASTDSKMNTIRISNEGDLAPHGSFELLKTADKVAKDLGMKILAGGVLSSDFFYNEDEESWKNWAKFGIKAIEMETSALYTIGLKNNVDCLSILTVTDIIPEDIHATSEEREIGYRSMAELALETIVNLHQP